MDAVTLKNMIFAFLAAVGAWIAQALGGWDSAIIALVAVMAIDYITGLLVAMVFHNSPKTESGGASSAAGLKGLLRKIVMLLFVGMGVLLDNVMGTHYIRTAIILFFIANECLSILENGGLMGIKYPKFLKSALETLRDQADGGTVTDTTAAEVSQSVHQIMNETNKASPKADVGSGTWIK